MEETWNDERQASAIVRRLSQEQANELGEAMKTVVKKRHGNLPSGLSGKAV